MMTETEKDFVLRLENLICEALREDISELRIEYLLAEGLSNTTLATQLAANLECLGRTVHTAVERCGLINLWDEAMGTIKGECHAPRRR